MPCATLEPREWPDMSEPTFCAGMADLASRYPGFIIDQWGVLHDGQAAYPGALACLERLRAGGSCIVLLSNSGKRVADNRARLRAMGFGEALFDAVVTSGEAAWRLLRDREEPFYRALGGRCLLWVQAGDSSFVEGLGVTLAEQVEDADFILVPGIDLGGQVADFEPALHQALARDLPMVCANPDVVVVAPDGLHMAPGAIARRYASLGGRVAYAGKPYAPIYRLCLEALAPLSAAQVLAVGDSLEHDVAGAARMGMDAALVMGGIHAAAFDLEHGRIANLPALERLVRAHGATPRWVLPRFRWRAGADDPRV
jgi:HAD superfamily hydrolase (TIGR01459 family)